MTALARLADLIDGLNARLGAIVTWLAVALVLVQFTVVVLRYGYGASFVWMQESVTYLHAALFMLAIGYAFLRDAHIRVDVFYARWTARRRALVDLVGVVIAVLPFCAVLVWTSWPIVALSWRIDEGAMQVGGLPLLPYLKALVPTMAALLGLQGIAVACRAILVLLGQAETHFPSKPDRAG